MPVQDLLQQTSQVIQANQPDMLGSVTKGFQIGMGIMEAYDKVQQNKELMELKKQEINQKKGDYVLGFFEKTMSVKDPGQRKNLWKLFPTVYKTAFGEDPNPAAIELFKSIPDEPNGVLPSASEVVESIKNPQKRAELLGNGGLQRFFGSPDIPTTINSLNDFAKREREIEVAENQFQGKRTIQENQTRDFRLKSVEETFRSNPKFQSRLPINNLIEQARSGNEKALQILEGEARRSTDVQQLNVTLDGLIQKGLPEKITSRVDRSDINSLNRAISLGSNYLAQKDDKKSRAEGEKDLGRLRKEVTGIMKTFKDKASLFNDADSLIRAAKAGNKSAMVPLVKMVQRIGDSGRITDSEFTIASNQASVVDNVIQQLKRITQGGTVPPALIPEVESLVYQLRGAYQSWEKDMLSAQYAEAEARGFDKKRVFSSGVLERISPKQSAGSQYEDLKKEFEAATGQKYPGNALSTKRFKTRNGKEYTILELRSFIEKMKGK